MPRQSQELMEPDENLLQICLDIHMAARGSSDPLASEIWERYGKVLFAARDNWKPSPAFSQQFDDVVLALVRAAIDDWLIVGEL